MRVRLDTGEIDWHSLELKMFCARAEVPEGLVCLPEYGKLHALHLERANNRFALEGDALGGRVAWRVVPSAQLGEGLFSTTNDIENSRWRYSLMDCGHDSLKQQTRSLARPVRKTHDYIRHYRGYWSDGGKCRIRIYWVDGCDTVVICSELPDDGNTSITNMAEYLAAEVIRYNEFALLPVWIEHDPKDATDGTSETFELVVFSSYTVRERAPYLGETRLTIGEPTWKTLDRETVEGLVGEVVQETRCESARIPFFALR